MRVLITLLLIALPMRLLAEVDCSVVDALERVQFAQLRLSQTRKIDPNNIDAQLIVREVGRPLGRFCRNVRSTPTHAHQPAARPIQRNLSGTIIRTAHVKCETDFTAP